MGGGGGGGGGGQEVRGGATGSLIVPPIPCGAYSGAYDVGVK
jgi:hypothetical protein